MGDAGFVLDLPHDPERVRASDVAFVTTSRLPDGRRRRALGASPAGAGAKEPKPLYGLRPFPRRGEIVTNELIDKLREDAAY